MMEVTGRIAEWIILFWKWRVPLLPEWSNVGMEAYDYRFIARKRRRCTLNGHMWELAQMVPTRNEYIIECYRCFPHIDSRRVIVSYNPFSTVEGKTD